MACTSWNEGYCIGVPSIDDEHRELVTVLDEIRASLQSTASQENKAVALRRLAAYTAVHFLHEEKLFVGTGYPRAAIHASKHRNLLLVLASFQKTGRYMNLTEQLEFLSRWVIDHLVSEDRRLGEYLNNSQTPTTKCKPAALPTATCVP
jgi:hemerythrin-like metal-binding protein